MRVLLDAGIDDRWPTAYGNYERQTERPLAPISYTQPSPMVDNHWYLGETGCCKTSATPVPVSSRNSEKTLHARASNNIGASV